MRSSRRLEQIPPYLFAELERKIAAKLAAGIDVISLGIGDPDRPTFEPIVAAAQRAGAEPSRLPLEPELGFAPDLEAIPPDALERARIMFVNYPNNPTGAIVPEGLFERIVELARAHEILIVHDNAYSETTFDGYVAP